jgi:hypothetical protein
VIGSPSCRPFGLGSTNTFAIDVAGRVSAQAKNPIEPGTRFYRRDLFGMANMKAIADQS